MKQHRETEVKQRYNSNLMEKLIYIYIYMCETKDNIISSNI